MVNAKINEGARWICGKCGDDFYSRHCAEKCCEEKKETTKMIKVETEFNKYGWKFIIRKSKEGVVTISQRSKDSSIHMMHKPMELRLQSEDFVELNKLINQIDKLSGDEE